LKRYLFQNQSNVCFWVCFCWKCSMAAIKP